MIAIAPEQSANYIEPLTCKCGVRVQIHEYLMDLETRLQMPVASCSRWSAPVCW